VSTPDPSTGRPPPRPRRHLMDPANPRPLSSQGMSMTTVQRWVMSVLAVTTIGHFAAGLVIAAVYMDSRPMSARIGIDVIAAVVGVLGVAAGFMIHQKSPLTPWLLVGLIPAAIGLFYIL
jgi:hypothetical protein